MNRLSKIGERKAIALILAAMKKTSKMAIPFGDDLAGYLLNNDRMLVMKTDMLVSKTDVPRGMSLFQAARKAVVMNVSDFAAKGVKPLALVVALGLPSNLTRHDLTMIAEGIDSGAHEYGAFVLGGDTGEATDLVITPSLFGVAKRAGVVLRSGASSEDFVAVTGSFGKPSAGLRILMNKSIAHGKVRDRLVDSVLMPHARLKEGLALTGTGALTSSTDSSDGLAWSLHELSNASSVGFVLDKLPLDEDAKAFAVENACDPVELTLYGGEEYELVVTVKPELWDKAEKAVTALGGKLLRIGHATAQKRVVLAENGKKRAIESRGWEHFKCRLS